MIDLEKTVNDHISDIVGLISRDLKGLLELQAHLLLSLKNSSKQSVDKANPEVESFQTSLNLISNFA
jgi:hypothetical protein